jgi:hypothetical protein
MHSGFQHGPQVFDFVDTLLNGGLVNHRFLLSLRPLAFSLPPCQPSHAFALGLRVGLQGLYQQVDGILYLCIEILQAQPVA